MRERAPERCRRPGAGHFDRSMPVTGVGKVFKPQLRWDAAERCSPRCSRRSSQNAASTARSRSAFHGRSRLDCHCDPCWPSAQISARRLAERGTRAACALRDAAEVVQAFGEDQTGSGLGVAQLDIGGRRFAALPISQLEEALCDWVSLRKIWYSATLPNSLMESSGGTQVIPVRLFALGILR